MAATASELRRIYAYLLGEHHHPERLPTLRRALNEVVRDEPSSRVRADQLLTIANDGVNPEMTFTQLECLRVVLSQEDFAAMHNAHAASWQEEEVYRRKAHRSIGPWALSPH